MTPLHTITFMATIPNLATAINIDGEEDSGGRIKIDVPGSEMPALLELTAYARGKPLRIMVEVLEP